MFEASVVGWLHILQGIIFLLRAEIKALLSKER